VRAVGRNDNCCDAEAHKANRNSGDSVARASACVVRFQTLPEMR
jgi:hypothetical protein